MKLPKRFSLAESVSAFDAYVNANPKYNGVLLRARGRVETQFKTYVNSCGSPNGLLRQRPAAFDRGKDVGDSLFQAYDSRSQAVLEIKKMVKDESEPYCPYCGLWIRSMGEHASPDRDHILPRSKFPELSIFLQNLILTCHECNTIKSDKCMDRSMWIMVNPYHDQFLSYRLLNATVHHNGRALVLEYTLDASGLSYLPTLKRKRVQRFFKEMELAKRLSVDAQGHFSRTIDSLVEGRREGMSLAKQKNVLRAVAKRTLGRRPNDPFALADRALARFPGLNAYLA